MIALFTRSRSLWFGLTLPFEALRLIFKHKLLLFWSALPIIVTLTLYYFLLGYIQTTIQAFAQTHFLSASWAQAHWVLIFMKIMVKILTFLVGVLSFALMSSIVASPFNDILADKTERFTEIGKISKRSNSQKIRILLIDVSKTIVAGFASFAALFLSWIPGVNLVVAVFAALLVCFQYTSYPQTRRGMGLYEGTVFLFSHFYSCLGFGAALSFLFAVPLFSCLTLPLAVVGGTMLVARAEPAKGKFRLK